MREARGRQAGRKQKKEDTPRVKEEIETIRKKKNTKAGEEERNIRASKRKK